MSLIGKNSIFILCAHAIEINLFPIQSILDLYLPTGNGSLRQTALVVIDVVIVCGIGMMLSMLSLVRKAFGVKA